MPLRLGKLLRRIQIRKPQMPRRLLGIRWYSPFFNLSALSFYLSRER
jgi:hypothetical protein